MLFKFSRATNQSPSFSYEGLAWLNDLSTDYLLEIKILIAPWLAQLVERQSAVLEVEGSSPRPDEHSGLAG